MQVFNVVHEARTSGFRNILLFVLWFWTGRGCICYSATNMFPLLDIGELEQNQLWFI